MVENCKTILSVLLQLFFRDPPGSFSYFFDVVIPFPNHPCYPNTIPKKIDP